MQTMLDTLLSAVGLATVGQYAWSLRAHFKSTAVPRGTMVISVVVLVSLLTYLYLQWSVDQPVAALLIGLLLQAGSLLLFWAAIFASREAQLLLAFDEKKPHGLVSIGPYKYVRHPFYLSYLIFWGGWAIGAWHPLGIVPLAVILGIYVTAARGEERKFEDSPLAEEYRAYRLRAGFLLPKFNG